MARLMLFQNFADIRQGAFILPGGKHGSFSEIKKNEDDAYR